MQGVAFDLGCHGYNHISANELTLSDYDLEIKEAIEFLRQTFEGQRVNTFAAPYNTVNESFIDYLDEYVIACRLGTNGTLGYLGKDFDMYRVRAFSVGESTDFASLQYQIGCLVDNGAWVVQYIHTVTEGAPYESVGISKATLDSHCKQLYDAYNGSVWFASFQDVAMYAHQHKNVEITEVDLTGDTMVFSVNTTLDTQEYNVPMSVKVYLPSFASSAYALVNGQRQELEINTDGANKYACVLDIPIENSTLEICFNN